MTLQHTRVTRSVGALSTLLIVLALALPASAQSRPPRVEISGGYQWVKLFSDGESLTMPAGWYVDTAVNLTNVIAVVGQVSGNFKTESRHFDFEGLSFGVDSRTTVYEFMGGTRFHLRRSHAVAFAHVLAGAARAGGSATFQGDIPGLDPGMRTMEDFRTVFTFEVGGGVNLMLNHHVGVRAGVDYLHLFPPSEEHGSTGSGAGGLRLTVGVALAFGR